VSTARQAVSQSWMHCDPADGKTSRRTRKQASRFTLRRAPTIRAKNQAAEAGRPRLPKRRKLLTTRKRVSPIKLHAAHDKYTTGIANTEGAIRLLNEKLTAAKQGTTAYDALMNQIAANQRKLDDQKAAQAKAETDAAASAQKAKDALIKAQE
jgi:hypothetical protein